MARVLIACEFSGVVRDAFKKQGHEAWSCDILPTEKEGNHIQADVLTILDQDWDLMIAHPPCTYLCSSGLHRNKNNPDRQAETEKALEFIRALLEAPIEKIALENPVGCISTRIRKPDQYIEPHQFGHDAKKKTGLWLKNLPKLKPTKHIKPRMIGSASRWGNQTDSGQNKLGPSKDRWKKRSLTYDGIAKAMSLQWGELLTTEN